ncbi:MAG: hypothetical protein NTV63_01005 [Candidatus Woesearchaeota archaeon]|nr:hypothetical protein [Candidatus Woesearchaeota archaeon]
MKSAKNFSKKGIDIGRIQHYLKRISGLKVLVIGDTIIDKYVFLKVYTRERQCCFIKGLLH